MFCKTASVSVKLACISNFFGKGCIQNFGFSFHLAGACTFQLLFYILKQGMYFGVPHTCTCGVDPVLQSGFDFQNFGFNFQLAGALCLSATLLQGIYFGVPFACTYGVAWALFCKVTLTFRILGSGRRGVPFKFQPLFCTLKQVNMFWSTFYLHVWSDVQRPCSGKRLVHPISLVRGVF